MKPLNILCCSTCDSGPESRWVESGIRYLFRRVFAHRAVNWILYGDNPDWLDEPLPEIDLVVATGSAEWTGRSFEKLLKLIGTLDVPWCFMGIDHPSDDKLRLTAEELAALSGACVVVRNPPALNALAGAGIASCLLPCPSLFAAKIERPSRQCSTVGVVVQSESFDLKDKILALVQALRRGYRVRVICNDVDGAVELSNVLPEPALYGFDSGQFMSMLASCDAIVSTAPGPAILGNSLLKPSILVGSDHCLAQSSKLYPYVLCRPPEQANAALQAIDVDSFVRKLFNWKRDIEEKYLEVLRPWLSNHGFCLV
ncbi:MAG: hypothetical protein WB992_12455 [Bryobacteraceae bacterium]